MKAAVAGIGGLLTLGTLRTLGALGALGALGTLGSPGTFGARAAAAAPLESAPARLPTGARLDPAGRSFDLGNMPLAMALAPERDRVVVLLAGWRQQGIQVVEIASGRVLQSLELPAAFLGLAFSADGRTLYVAGGNEDVVFRFAWKGGAAVPAGSLPLADKGQAKFGTRFPAGLALSPDGKRLYVAENLADTLAVVDLASGKVVQRLPAGRYPYAVAAGPRGEVYVSAWGGTTVAVFSGGPSPRLGEPAGEIVEAGRIEVGRHPSALLLSPGGARLFVASASTDRVAVVDTGMRRLIAELRDPPPGGPASGSTPSALALADGGRRLLVAESDSNAVAVFDLASGTSGVPGGPSPPRDRLAGRIPVGWYPTAVLTAGESLLVVNGKGRGSGPNPRGPQPAAPERDPRSYTLGQTEGTLTVLPALPARAALAACTRRVAQANGWVGGASAAAAHGSGGGLRARGARQGAGAGTGGGAGAAAGAGVGAGASVDAIAGAQAALYPPLRHVVYVIKENRTYDQVFGDLPGGDGDPGLLFFHATEAPNHRALAQRFGLYDRFFTNGEVSTQGHSWSTAAYATDYTEKTTPSGYSSRRGGEGDEGDADEPASGHLWDLARARGLEVRNYGEFGKAGKDAGGATVYRATVPSLQPFTSPTYPAWDLTIPDQKRADAWLAEFRTFVERGSMPALEILHLPNDHTAGARPGLPTPRAYMADNDLALGRIVEALTRSPFWRETVVFVVEDDAQNGPDHVDSHRAPLLVISPYSRPGTVHRFVNTTDVVATIEEILGLGTLTQFDTFGRPLREIFAAAPDPTPYQALIPAQPLTDTNPADGPAARQSLGLDLTAPDAIAPAELNAILWRTVKGELPCPPPARLSTLEIQRGR
ncbi:MAG TPA: alkaline phosphatase family protein [Thermoanaerobaculia bacterium]|nr:alkaline phosphatase family protein [Thermoanaerobaculia bacterium]